MTYAPWAAGMEISAERLNDRGLQVGIQLVSFTSQTQYVQSVTFPEAFSIRPNVYVNINSAPSSTARWAVRAINVTNTGFDIFAFTMYVTAPAVSWSGVEVSWAAVI